MRQEASAPDPLGRAWEPLVEATIERVRRWQGEAGSTGALLDAIEGGTLGERWARCGLPPETWAAIWAHREDAAEVGRLCNELLDSIEAERTAPAFRANSNAKARRISRQQSRPSR